MAEFATGVRADEVAGVAEGAVEEEPWNESVSVVLALDQVSATSRTMEVAVVPESSVVTEACNEFNICYEGALG